MLNRVAATVRPPEWGDDRHHFPQISSLAEAPPDDRSVIAVNAQNDSEYNKKDGNHSATGTKRAEDMNIFGAVIR
jgi:hypothetical protein